MSDMLDFLDVLDVMMQSLTVLFAYAERRAAQERGTRAPADEVSSTRSRPAWDDGFSIGTSCVPPDGPVIGSDLSLAGPPDDCGGVTAIVSRTNK